MAKEAKTEAEVAAVAPPKKSKKLMVIIMAILLLLLFAGGGVSYLIWKNRTAATDEDGELANETVAVEKKKDTKETAPVYVALDAFTVNLVGDQFLQLVISVEVADLHAGDRLKMYTPKIRNNVMLLLSGKQAVDLVSKEGKENLAKEIRNLMSEILEPGAKEGDGPIREVLFTSFIIQ